MLRQLCFPDGSQCDSNDEEQHEPLTDMKRISQIVNRRAGHRWIPVTGVSHSQIANTKNRQHRNSDRRSRLFQDLNQTRK